MEATMPAETAPKVKKPTKEKEEGEKEIVRFEPCMDACVIGMRAAKQLDMHIVYMEELASGQLREPLPLYP